MWCWLELGDISKGTFLLYYVYTWRETDEYVCVCGLVCMHTFPNLYQVYKGAQKCSLANKQIIKNKTAHNLVSKYNPAIKGTRASWRNGCSRENTRPWNN